MTIKNTNFHTKTLSILSLLLFIISIYFLGYLYSSRKNPNPFKNNCVNPKFADYSISNAIANGHRNSMTALISIMIVLSSVLLYIRKGDYFILRICILVIIGILFISITYINPYASCGKNKNHIGAHFILAGIAFLLNLFFIGLTCYSLQNKNISWYKNPIYIVFIINIILLILNFSFILTEIKRKKQLRWGVAGELSYAFAVTENLQLFITMIIIAMIGFYTI